MTMFTKLVVAAAFLKLAVAQQMAVCDKTKGMDWMNNSKGQNPCDVASYLGGACSSATFIVPPLAEGNIYSGPQLSQTTSCKCSTVYYSALSACAVCQGRNVGRWSTYSRNCSQVYLTVFPMDLQTPTPHWMYQNVSASDTFDPAVANADFVAGLPESTPVIKPTSSSTPSSPAGPAETQPPERKVNAGAIAGGVVGGVVLICLGIVAAILIIRRRRLNQRPPSSLVNYGPDGVTPSFYGPSTVFTSPTPKLYDPSDPTTFPPSPPISSDASTPYVGAFPPRETNVQGKYTGAPEI